METEQIKCRRFKDLRLLEERDLCPKYQKIKKLIKRYSSTDSTLKEGLGCEEGNCHVKWNPEEPDNEWNKSTEYRRSSQGFCLGDHNISWGAKGLYCYLLAMSPNRETVKLNHLEIVSKDGLDHTNTRIIELMEHGYIKREMIRVSNKGIQGYEYTIR